MLRMIRRAIVFGTRSRLRFIIFVLIFTILSSTTILLMSGFESFDHQDMLKHRGVVVSAVDWDSVTQADAEDLVSATIGSRNDVEAMIIRYINFGADYRIFGIDPQFEWANPDISPTRIVEGRYLSHDGEVMVSDTFLSPSTNSLNGYQFYSDASVGDTLFISSDITKTQEEGTNGMSFRVVGKFATTSDILADLTNNDRRWIIISNKDLTKLIDILGISSSSIYVRHVVFIAKGPLILDTSPYETVDDIGAEVTAKANAALWKNPSYTPKADKVDERNLRFLALIGGFFGTFIVATMYSYLISRFRRMEVAILKAIGYRRKDVLTFLLGEIVSVSILGFAAGLTIVQLWLIMNRESAYIQWILWSPLSLMSFLAVVILSIPGFLLLSTRIFKVRPIEIFRQK